MKPCINRFSVWLRRHSAYTLDELMKGFENCVETSTMTSIRTSDVYDYKHWISGYKAHILPTEYWVNYLVPGKFSFDGWQYIINHPVFVVIWPFFTIYTHIMLWYTLSHVLHHIILHLSKFISGPYLIFFSAMYGGCYENSHVIIY